MNKENTTLGRSLSYLVIGGGIGAVLALLFAPKSGKHFRAEIAVATRKGINKTEEIAEQLGEKAQSVYADTKTKAGELYDSAKQTISSASNEIAEISENAENIVTKTTHQITANDKDAKKEFEGEENVINHKFAAKGN